MASGPGDLQQIQFSSYVSFRRNLLSRRGLCTVFIDFTKASDTVDRNVLWELLEHYGCPDIFVKIIREFQGIQATVPLNGEKMSI